MITIMHEDADDDDEEDGDDGLYALLPFRNDDERDG